MLSVFFDMLIGLEGGWMELVKINAEVPNINNEGILVNILIIYRLLGE